MPKYINKTVSGGRKRATAIVKCQKIEDGSPVEIIVNGKEIREYFKVPRFIENAMRAITVTELTGYHLEVKCIGGGVSGQADALKLGIAKTILGLNSILKDVLKKHDLLTRDQRKVYPKIAGFIKARKAQVHKRR